MRGVWILIGVGLLAALAGCSNEVGGEAASIELSPRSLLLLGPDDPWPLTATVRDADGRVIDVPVSWEVEDGSVVSVDADGVVTATADAGSTYVRAVVGETRSNGALVAPIRAQPGTILVPDSDVISPVEPLDETPTGAPITEFRVELAGAGSLSVGDRIVAREEAPLMGRVTSVSGSSVELEIVPLAELFSDIDLTMVLPAQPASLDVPGRATEPLDVSVGEVQCELQTDAARPELEVTQEEIDLSGLRVEHRVKIASSQPDTIGTRVRGQLTGQVVMQARLPDPVVSEVRCEYGLRPIIIPVFGAFSKIFSPFVEPAVGFQLEGTVRGAELTYEVTLDVSSAEPVDVGYTWTPEGGVELHRDLSLSTDSSARVITPNLSEVEVAIGFYGYVAANLKVGFPALPGAALGLLSFRSGLRQRMDVRVDDLAELDDPAYRSHYATEYLFQIAPGDGLEWINVIAGASHRDDPWVDAALPLATSPVGALSVVPTPIVPGEDATPVVTFESDLYGLIPNIAEVALYHRRDAGAWGLIAAIEGTVGQLVYPFSWVAGTGDVGEHHFAAMVRTHLAPTVWLEIANDSRQRVTVEGDVAPFEIIELYDPTWAPHTFLDVNDAGQLLGREPTNPLAVLITPMPPAAPGEAPRWVVDSDGDGRNDLAAPILSIDNGRGPGASSRPIDLNNAGQVVGDSDVRTRGGGNERYGAYWDTIDAPVDMRLELITYVGNVLYPQYSISYTMMPRPAGVAAINDSGAMLINVAGTSLVFAGAAAQFLGGDPTCQGCIEGRLNVGSLVYAVDGTGADLNNSGRVCGMALDSVGAWRPATWTAGGDPLFLGDLGTPVAGRGPGPNALNASGQCVGTLPSGTMGLQRPVRWDDLVATDLGTFGGDSGAAVDIDDLGAVIGWADDALGVARPFLYLPAPRWGVGAGMHDLADLVQGPLLPDELPTRMSNTGLILTSEGRLLRASAG